MSGGDSSSELAARSGVASRWRRARGSGSGQWGAAAAGVVLILGWRLMGPLGGFPGLACGLAGGVLALLAIFRRGERAFTVYAALVPFVNVVVFVFGELLIGH